MIYSNEESKSDQIEIVSDEINKIFSNINNNIKLSPQTYKYLLLEYISTLYFNVSFSTSLEIERNTSIKLEKIHLFASISDTLLALHTSDAYNFIIKSVLKTNTIS